MIDVIFNEDPEAMKIAEIIKARGLEEAAKDFGLEIAEIDGEKFVQLPGYFVSDDYSSAYIPESDVYKAVEEYVSTFEKGNRSEWIRVYANKPCLRYEGEFIIGEMDGEYFLEEIEPKEPECPFGEHDWRSPYEVVGGLKENPGVFGKSGGVRIKEVCANCGVYMITDTWMEDGYGGYQTGVEYHVADEDSLNWIARNLFRDVSDLCFYLAETKKGVVSVEEDEKKMRIVMKAKTSDDADELYDEIEEEFREELEHSPVIFLLNQEGSSVRVSIAVRKA